MSKITILCTEDGINSADSIGALLSGLGVQVDKVNQFTEVSKEAELVIVLQAEQWGEDFNRYALEHHITWLPVRFSHSAGRIGPILIPGCSACYECALRRERSNGMRPLEPRNAIFDLSWSVLSGIIATEAAKWISCHTSSFPPLTLGHVLDFDAFHLQGEINPVYKLPTCPCCGVRHEPRLAAQPWREAELVLES